VLRHVVRAGDLLRAGFGVDAGRERLAQRPHAPARPRLRFEHRHGVAEVCSSYVAQRPARPAPTTTIRCGRAARRKPFHLR